VSLSRYFPVADWIRSYPQSWLRFDIFAGLTTAAVVIPKTMATATITGLPVALGLYTALAPMLVYTLTGASRTLSVSTTTTIGMLTGAALTRVAAETSPEQAAAAAVTLALIVGAALFAASILKLGRLSSFISEPVLIGFKIGLGLTIVADQAPKLLGIHFPKGSFIRNIESLWRHLPETSAPTLALGALTLVLLFALRLLWPRAPAALFAVAGGIAVSSVMGLEKSGVAIVGHMPSGLPGFKLPGFSLIEELWPAAIGIALMSFTETIAVGRAFADARDRRPDPDQELRALGAANLLGSMFHAMPAGGGTSETAVNMRAGARSQISELVTSAMAALALLLLSQVISLIPQATLAAVVIGATTGLLNPRELLAIRRLHYMEFWWGVSAAVGVALLGPIKGIVAAVIISTLALIYESTQAPVYALARKRGTNVFRRRSAEHPEDESFPGLLVLRTEGRMYFANAQQVGDKVWAFVHEAKPKVLVVDCSAIPDFEYTALRMLTIGEERLREAGIALWLVDLTPVALDVVRRSELGRRLGHERMCFNVAEAVDRYLALNQQTARA